MSGGSIIYVVYLIWRDVTVLFFILSKLSKPIITVENCTELTIFPEISFIKLFYFFLSFYLVAILNMYNIITKMKKTLTAYFLVRSI